MVIPALLHRELMHYYNGQNCCLEPYSFAPMRRDTSHTWHHLDEASPRQNLFENIVPLCWNANSGIQSSRDSRARPFPDHCSCSNIDQAAHDHYVADRYRLACAAWRLGAWLYGSVDPEYAFACAVSCVGHVIFDKDTRVLSDVLCRNIIPHLRRLDPYVPPTRWIVRPVDVVRLTTHVAEHLKHMALYELAQHWTTLARRLMKVMGTPEGAVERARVMWHSLGLDLSDGREVTQQRISSLMDTVGMPGNQYGTPSIAIHAMEIGIVSAQSPTQLRKAIETGEHILSTLETSILLGQTSTRLGHRYISAIAYELPWLELAWAELDLRKNGHLSKQGLDRAVLGYRMLLEQKITSRRGGMRYHVVEIVEKRLKDTGILVPWRQPTDIESGCSTQGRQGNALGTCLAELAVILHTVAGVRRRYRRLR